MAVVVIISLLIDRGDAQADIEDDQSEPSGIPLRTLHHLLHCMYPFQTPPPISAILLPVPDTETKLQSFAWRFADDNVLGRVRKSHEVTAPKE